MPFPPIQLPPRCCRSWMYPFYPSFSFVHRTKQNQFLAEPPRSPSSTRRRQTTPLPHHHLLQKPFIYAPASPQFSTASGSWFICFSALFSPYSLCSNPPPPLPPLPFAVPYVGLGFPSPDRCLDVHVVVLLDQENVSESLRTHPGSWIRSLFSDGASS